MEVSVKGRMNSADVPVTKRHTKSRYYLFAYALIAPAMILVAVLILYPLLDAIYTSLTASSFIQPVPKFVGLRNYLNMFSSPVFWQVVLNSFYWTVAVVVAQLVIGILVALLLNMKFYGRALLRVIVILPWVMPGIIAGMIWKLMYDPYLGTINTWLLRLGLIHNYVAWLSQPSTVLPSLIIAAIWKGAPFSVLMYLAALQSVSKDSIEASMIDGASPWRRLINVVIPEISPTIRTTILLTTVWTFNYFDLIYVTTQGGPGHYSQIFPTYIYNLAFVKVQYGLASAYGVISIIILLVFSVFYVRELNKARVFE
ncbi:sugar ABC transporter permease [Alicyclobacillus tolerans]|uniref:carbohydrate ABC transporter permease n=1 Tax=Alicyclobacillus tolerans TaxID=90970 RepID=UPI001F3EFA8C|nr:sugar ABC transporter permease [Alicyclobacillus tolerans]MCF8567957.1 sugar ABC transporter permease [Alicyclobacillus tolerans]